MDNQQLVLDYINNRSQTVPGWLYPIDMFLIALLDQLQKAFDVRGNICEVGVYKGKSLILLGMLLRDDERLFAFDVFPEDFLEATKANMAALCPTTARVEYVQGDTSSYTADALRATLPFPLRLLHIDAGHEYHEVLHCLYMLAPHVHVEGVIVMDDYQDREFPGVAAAVLDFCLHHRPRQFVPFVSGGNKMYLCSPGIAHRYQAGLIGQPGLADTMRLSRIRDHRVLVAASREAMRSAAIAKMIHDEVADYSAEVDLDGLARIAQRHSQHASRVAAASSSEADSSRGA